MQDDGTDEVSTKDDALATVLIGGFAILAPRSARRFFRGFLLR